LYKYLYTYLSDDKYLYTSTCHLTSTCQEVQVLVEMKAALHPQAENLREGGKGERENDSVGHRTMAMQLPGP
jgi:hypothetical protein